jgi:hypothetical protein
LKHGVLSFVQPYEPELLAYVAHVLSREPLVLAGQPELQVI